MTDFLLGVAFGGMIVGTILSPFLIYFGIVYLNLRKMEKQLAKETEKPEPRIEVDEKTVELIQKAEKIIIESKEE